MESKVNYTAIGLFVVLFSIAIGLISVWLTMGLDKPKTYKTYLVYTNDSVSGLSIQAPVKFNGVIVGQVIEIELDLQKPQLVKILLNVEEEVPITTGTIASLASQGITGIAFVTLSVKVPDAPTLEREPGEPYPVIPSGPSFLNTLHVIAKKVAADLNLLTKSIQKIFDKENIAAFKKILLNLDEFSGTLADESDVLKKLFENAADASESFPSLMNSIEQNIVPGTETLLMRFNAIAEELEQNPSILIRGKSPQAPGPGE